MIRTLWTHFEEIAGSIILAVMTTVAFLNVVTRYFIKYSFSFTEEIEVNLFVWLVLLGTSLAFRKGAHLSMNFFYDRFPPAVRKIFFLATTGICVAFFAVLAHLGRLEVLDELALSVTTESLGIPVVVYTAAVPVLSLLVIVRILQQSAAALRAGDI
ncbi:MULTISPECIES: TRAP transporter small permease [Aminiphilus]|jgi:TRAP-type C4-dicarboxylate transport system permease small subunit|uniref:TRAP transporter small permease n=1 Tax=Aminiphilus TaxID=290731 RepID=UPI000478563E|nr:MULTISPECIES: TRAP transporter small permease [Aminiphilus]